VPALAIVLGANVGTTVIVQILSFNVAAAAPALLASGWWTGARARINASKQHDQTERRTCAASSNMTTGATLCSDESAM